MFIEFPEPNIFLINENYTGFFLCECGRIPLVKLFMNGKIDENKIDCPFCRNSKSISLQEIIDKIEANRIFKEESCHDNQPSILYCSNCNEWLCCDCSENHKKSTHRIYPYKVIGNREGNKNEKNSADNEENIKKKYKEFEAAKKIFIENEKVVLQIKKKNENNFRVINDLEKKKRIKNIIDKISDYQEKNKQIIFILNTFFDNFEI